MRRVEFSLVWAAAASSFLPCSSSVSLSASFISDSLSRRIRPRRWMASIINRRRRKKVASWSLRPMTLRTGKQDSNPDFIGICNAATLPPLAGCANRTAPESNSGSVVCFSFFLEISPAELLLLLFQKPENKSTAMDPYLSYTYFDWFDVDECDHQDDS